MTTPTAATASNWSKFTAHTDQLTTLASVISLVSWDQEVMMPAGAVEMRGQQSSYLQTLRHSLLIDPAFQDLLRAVEADPALETKQKALVQWISRDARQAAKVPAALVTQMAATQVRANEVWKNARKENNFQLFAPILDQIVELKKQVAHCVREPGQGVYESMVDEFEPSFPLAKIEFLFARLKEQLVPFTHAVVEHRARHEKPALSLQMPLDAQRAFNAAMVRRMGFDMNTGRLDEATHPFCGGYRLDVRLTTRYQESDWTNSLYSVLHEGGHGLYEQGLGRAHGTSPLGEAPSLGIHESQSRFWENCIGRGRGFANFVLPFARQFAELDARLTPENYYWYLNTPEFSYIRVDSDELTYNLHILIRFEIEKALFAGDLTVADLPDAWNEKVTSYLGLPAPTPAQGCMQDVHWAWGAFGYFPTYTIGNLISGELFAKIRETMDTETLAAKGDFAPIRDWLYEKVHLHGRECSTLDIVRGITGQDLGTDAFMTYLKEKYQA